MSTRSRNSSATFRVALSGLLIALMLVLGFIESMIPITAGIPGIKLGLSNGVLIFAVYMLGVPEAYCLMGLKVLLSGLMFGGVSAIAYAFAGGLLSLTAMCLLSRAKSLHPAVVSIVGGVMHNVGQVGLAMLILHTNLLFYLAVLVLVGAGCGLLTGVCAASVMKHMRTLGWKTVRTSGKGALMIAVAAALIAVLAFLSVRTLTAPRTSSVTVEFTTDDGAAMSVDPLAEIGGK